MDQVRACTTVVWVPAPLLSRNRRVTWPRRFQWNCPKHTKHPYILILVALLRTTFLLQPGLIQNLFSFMCLRILYTCVVWQILQLSVTPFGIWGWLHYFHRICNIILSRPTEYTMLWWPSGSWYLITVSFSYVTKPILHHSGQRGIPICSKTWAQHSSSAPLSVSPQSANRDKASPPNNAAHRCISEILLSTT